MNKDYIIRIAQEVGLAPAAYRNYGNQIGRLEALVKFFFSKGTRSLCHSM